MPFLGDYIDIAGPTIVANGPGGWKFNTAPTSAPVFYATWTDNRDVVPPKDGDWTHYTPVGAAAGRASSTRRRRRRPASRARRGCATRTSTRAASPKGLLVGSPQNVKPLFAAPKTRAFIVTLQNLTSQDRTFTLTLVPPGSGVSYASFLQTRLDLRCSP